MLLSRCFEQAVQRLWEAGEISGEMHLGIGEEAIAAGIVTHLRPDDALALDHRGTPPLVARGVSLELLLKEMLGRPDGLCRGQGGHMHLLSPEHGAVSSGIVGAAAPLALGMALAAEQLHPGGVAVAFFGEGAMNQGMVLESLNLAAIWRLAVLFVCKDNGWAITTPSPSVTAGDLVKRAKAFGVPASSVDGADVTAVWRAAGQGIQRARRGEGPTFIRARCTHLAGHFLGDPLLRLVRAPVHELRQLSGPLFSAATSFDGAGLGQRAMGLGGMMSVIGRFAVEHRHRHDDPLDRARAELDDANRLSDLEGEVEQQVRSALDAVRSLSAS